MKRLIAAAAALTAVLAPAAQAAQPRLEACAILPAETTFPAIPNTEPAPAPGATQPVGGFSALLDAGHGDFYAMPDNGFGSKANSRSFILRLYEVRPQWRTHRVADRKPILAKREIVDLLDIEDKAGISLPGRPGDFGLGDPFKFPLPNG